MIKNRKAGQDETFFMTKTKKLRLFDVMFYNYRFLLTVHYILKSEQAPMARRKSVEILGGK